LGQRTKPEIPTLKEVNMTTIVTRGSNYHVKVRVKGFPTATEPIKTEKV